MSDTIYIYGLKEVDSDEIRYVGQTCDLKMRRYTHLSSKDGQIDHPKRLWIENAKRRGIEIEIITLEECGDSVNEVEREQYWISHYESLGHRLTNVDKAKPSTYRRRRTTTTKTKVIETVVEENIPEVKIAPVAVSATEHTAPILSNYEVVENAALSSIELAMRLMEDKLRMTKELLQAKMQVVEMRLDDVNRKIEIPEEISEGMKRINILLERL